MDINDLVNTNSLDLVFLLSWNSSLGGCEAVRRLGTYDAEGEEYFTLGSRMSSKYCVPSTENAVLAEIAWI